MTADEITVGRIVLRDQHSAGVFPEHANLRFEAGAEGVRLTIPAREALEAAGAVVTPAGQASNGAPLYDIRLGPEVVIPTGLVLTHTQIRHPHGGYELPLSVRLSVEPPYPGEVDEVVSIWNHADLTPCPTCGRGLVWYEAGYVPGYRVCAGWQHHHWIVWGKAEGL